MRFVVKIGSHLLTNEDHSLNTAFIKHITEQIIDLYANGHEPIIVTSGAVAAGRKGMTLKKENKHVPYRQALAAIGQTFLLETYWDSFAQHDIPIGQVLLTMMDFDHHANFLSTKNTLELLLELRVIPVINENDVTTFESMKFGHNDILSAHVASMMNAETLVMLTDVEGLFDDDPKENPEAKLIPTVTEITPELQKMAKESASKHTLGGMAGKIEAAQYAIEAGVNVWIARGEIPNVLTELLEGEEHHGTLFKTQFTPREARRKWLQTQQLEDAGIVLDAGAEKAVLEMGKSLLPSGIVRVEGEFKRGNVVALRNEDGEKIGFGQVNYSRKATEKIKGKHSSEIQEVLGYVLEDVVMHRDNMVT